jgi:hypothetical protein
MSAPRLAVWIAGAAVFGAWLASAAGVTRQPRIVTAAPVAPESVQLDALAAEVQAQAGRLRERLANAPMPRANQRNPFSFAPRATPSRAHSAPVAVPPEEAQPLESVPSEPVLELIGIAESPGSSGLVRTAMITDAQQDLIMVVAGQRILGRYDVVSVGEEAVDLKDIDTGRTRRLILH